MGIEMIVKDEPMTHCECGHLLEYHRGIRSVGYEKIDRFCIDENCDCGEPRSAYLPYGSN